jgi:diguanylate cyclase (GGDEF)-like protein
LDLTQELIQRSKSWTKMTQVPDVLHSACEFLDHYWNIDAGYFLSYNDEAGIRTEYSWGLGTPKGELSAATYGSHEFLPQLQVAQGKWLTADEAPLPWQEIMRRESLVGVAGWLITIDNVVGGIFVLGQRTVHDNDADMFSLSMAHICLMVEMIIYRRNAEKVSLHDPLTGLLNRRGFMIEFARIMSENPQNQVFMLVVLDVDDLKQINDTHGHLTGDSLLIQVGHLMQVYVHEHNAICARYGGDEFVVLLQYEKDEIHDCEHEISLWFEAHAINVSVGCAVFGRDGEHFEECFNIADQRMYRRKLA